MLDRIEPGLSEPLAVRTQSPNLWTMRGFPCFLHHDALSVLVASQHFPRGDLGLKEWSQKESERWGVVEKGVLASGPC